MVTRKKEDETEPKKKSAQAKKAPAAKAAAKPAKKTTSTKKPAKTAGRSAAKADKPVAPATTSLVFQAPDPGLFPAWTPGPDSAEGDKVVRRRSRANRKTGSDEKKTSESTDSGQPQKV
ncbi:MAG: hypothetical protein ACO3I5_00435, partial [Pontimonas sp.]